MPRGVLGPDTFSTVTTGPGRQAPDMGTIVTVTGVATCSSGNVSATFRLEGSNDGINWFAVGADQVITAAASPQLASFTRIQISFAQYRVNCTALTGTGAQLVTHIAVGA
jgi:hypothetical protein